MPRDLTIACIEDHPKAVLLLRAARRRAQEKGGKWRAVFMETPAAKQADDGAHERVLQLLTLAEQMGGETLSIEAETTEKGLAALLKKEEARISLVVIGSVEPEGPLERLRPLPWMRLVRLAGRQVQVEVVPLSGQAHHRSLLEKLHLRAAQPQDIAYALLAVGIAYLGALFLQWLLPPAVFHGNGPNVVLLFMTACAFSAARFGLLPGLVASVASFLTLNYYFIAPYYDFGVPTLTDAINLLIFLFAALFISLFTGQTRNYGRKAAQREVSTQALFTLYRTASNAFSREQALEKLQRRLERMLGVDVAFFLPLALFPERIDPVFPPKLILEAADRQALEACWSEMKTTGLASPLNPGTRWRFEPMVSSVGEAGVIGIRPRGQVRLDPWLGRLLTAIADQTASVLDHLGLERSREETRVGEEREKLRSMLLSSVSHDFKTPLAGIIGALSVHRSMGERLTPQKRAELIEAAIDEAQRLDSFITNILDMTRLESGNITFRKEWHNVDAMIGNVLKRLQHRCRHHRIEAQPVPPGLEAYMDAMMTEQVVQNVIDNACKYTPEGTRIDIGVTVDDAKGLLVEVRDRGKGLPAEKLDRIFDKYARLHKKDTQVAGTGLGLAIGKAIMEAQGGWITAANHPGGGAVFTLCLPQWRQAETHTAQEKTYAPLKQAHRSH